MRTYKTDNLGLAAYLVVNGYELQGVTKPQGLGRWHEFLFTSDQRLDDHVQAFLAEGKPLNVNAREYAATLSKVKRAMYANTTND
jgi:hypothetical protein